MRYITLFLFAFFAISLTAQDPASTEYRTEVLHTNEVYFDFGKHDLRPDADSTLQEVLTQIKSQKNLQINLTAHTDAIGSDGANEALSKRRSNSVRQYLVQNGIADDLITDKTYGEKNPVADNESDIGRQANRRATIEVVRRIPVVKLSGRITDDSTGLGVSALLIFRTKNSRDSIQTDTSGYFLNFLPAGTVVGIDVYAPCYFPTEKMFKVAANGELNIEINEMKEGAVWAIPNLYFVGNQAKLLKKSQPTLPKILKFMRNNDCYKIEIAGHINRPNEGPVAETSWDFKLSLNRAKMVYEYLLNNGISEDRMTFKGYGNSEMIYPRASIRNEAHQAKNRRVEIRITEKIDKSAQ